MFFQGKFKIKKRNLSKKRSSSVVKDSSTLTSTSTGVQQAGSIENSEHIREIISRAQVNISRNYLETAKNLIVEGLSIAKDNKELNLLLADVYERDNKFQNAQYIYKDMLEVYPEDGYILQRLGSIYSLRGKMDKSFECYKKALEQDKSNIEILDILAHLSLEEKNYTSCLKYATSFLKEKPRDAEKLSLKGYSLEMLGKHSEAVKAYRSVLDLQPYNKDIQERLAHIEK